MRGAVADGGKLLITDDLEVRSPEAHEVSVRVVSSGICRSDLLPLDQGDPHPMVLGHEAAGYVQAVGDSVEGIEIGQRVAVACQRPCGACGACARGLFTACPQTFGIGLTPFSLHGSPVRSLARVSSLAEVITVDAFQVHPISVLDPASASLLGCAVSTGYGTVHNVANLKAGESLAVLGVGGIGVNSIQAARLLGASRIVAVDVNSAKSATAARFGADEFIGLDVSATPEELRRELVEQIGAPVDAVIDCTGKWPMIAAAMQILDIGGRLALLGIPSDNSPAEIDIVTAMYKHLTIVGAMNGACDPHVDMPEIVSLAESGKLDLAGQISHQYPLADLHDALDALRGGDVLRIVIDMI